MAAPDPDLAARNPLIRRLERITKLSEDDRNAIIDVSRATRDVGAHRDIISEGDQPDNVHLMLRGWAARYKMLPGGARQITAYLIPGDFCDLHVTILRKMDHGITALTPATVAYISREHIRELTEQRPALTRALWWATLVNEGVLREWIVSIGRRDAYERLAHLLCELHSRMRMIGLAVDETFDLPLTQEQLADTLGLSAVHINRTLMRLRREGLIELGGKTLRILNGAVLRDAAGFDPTYLHEGDIRN
ncbi:Crp/Fnr family transcriptional regulator [Sphingosinicella sp. CPCC 101087]|uniref:Crp/Fnr family transcriptional regulator n=1 Tax=Sphingosinicella sp. CPCC 101087 TaxID=2497754 RepID=UPI00101CA080|nr:Crp/Fnr family transcriptional regulator [Sphingosinicella sp. CPCC 101087]